VFAWGAVVMLIGDHFVGPALVGGAARLPFLLALVGIFGGCRRSASLRCSSAPNAGNW
jgi:hypothetical protein